MSEDMMVIYEVNIAVDTDIYSQYELWLQGHVQDMLAIPGFVQACILKPEHEVLPGKEKLTVQYKLESREALEVYFNEYADKAREEGLRLFKDKFMVDRRIYALRFTCVN